MLPFKEQPHPAAECLCTLQAAKQWVLPASRLGKGRGKILEQLWLNQKLLL